MLKVQLESTVAIETLVAVNEIITIAGLKSISKLTQLMNILAGADASEVLEGVIFGRGGSHIWVANKRTNERILLITEI